MAEGMPCYESHLHLGLLAVSSAEFAHDAAYKDLGVSKQHQGVIEIVERVIDAREARIHAALDDHHGVGFVNVEDWHPVDGAGSIGAGGRVGDVVGANHQSDVGLGEVTIDLIHLNQAVVGNIGFGEQHIHVARHASGNGVNGEAHVHTALAQSIVEFADFVLSLSHSHAVSRNHDDAV